MKSKIKNYAAFLPQYRIIKWLIVMYPFLLLPSFLSCTKLDEFSAQICFLGNMAGIPFVEIFFQMFLFRGVLEKERLSYFKSSAEGVYILKNSLFMDTVRRFSYLGFLMIVAIFLYSTDLFVKTRYVKINGRISYLLKKSMPKPETKRLHFPGIIVYCNCSETHNRKLLADSVSGEVLCVLDMALNNRKVTKGGRKNGYIK